MTVVVARGLCCKHGALGECTIEGCTNFTEARGLCGKHGARGTCRQDGCTTTAAARGLCWKHGVNSATAKGRQAYGR